MRRSLITVLIAMFVVAACEMRTGDQGTQNFSLPENIPAPKKLVSNGRATVTSEVRDTNEPNQFYALVTVENYKDPFTISRRSNGRFERVEREPEETSPGHFELRDGPLLPDTLYTYQVNTDFGNPLQTHIRTSSDLVVTPDMEIPERVHYHRIFFGEGTVVRVTGELLWVADMFIGGRGAAIILDPYVTGKAPTFALLTDEAKGELQIKGAQGSGFSGRVVVDITAGRQRFPFQLDVRNELSCIRKFAGNYSWPDHCDKLLASYRLKANNPL